jgi:hypothetical protein
MTQTYKNYYKNYYQTESGRITKRKSQTKYRQKLAKHYGVSQAKAIQLRKEENGKV